MGEYRLTSGTTRLLNLRQQLLPFDPAEASDQEINAFNRAELSSRRVFRKLYRPVSRNISEETFIIPVNDGAAVGGYLFRNTARRKNQNNSLIVYFHNGGWKLGNMDICSAVCSNICRATGAEVLAVDFRLAPAFKFPVPVEDCYSAFLWAEQGTRYWKSDPAKVYLMGDCSGAALAAAVSRLARDRKGPKPAGLILVDPITDCRLRTSSHELYSSNPMLSKAQLASYISSYQREPKDILDPLFSPLLALDHSRLPETLIIAAEYDPLFDDAKLYAEALAAADTPVKFIECKGRLHGFMNYPSSERWADYMSLVADFVCGMKVESIELETGKQRSGRGRSLLKRTR